MCRRKGSYRLFVNIYGYFMQNYEIHMKVRMEYLFMNYFPAVSVGNFLILSIKRTITGKYFFRQLYLLLKQKQVLKFEQI